MKFNTISYDQKYKLDVSMSCLYQACGIINKGTNIQGDPFDIGFTKGEIDTHAIFCVEFSIRNSGKITVIFNYNIGHVNM